MGVVKPKVSKNRISKFRDTIILVIPRKKDLSVIKFFLFSIASTLPWFFFDINKITSIFSDIFIPYCFIMSFLLIRSILSSIGKIEVIIDNKYITEIQRGILSRKTKQVFLQNVKQIQYFEQAIPPFARLINAELRKLKGNMEIITEKEAIYMAEGIEEHELKRLFELANEQNIDGFRENMQSI